MSINWLSDAEPPPAILALPPAAVDLGEAHAAIELWEHYSRKTLDDTQRLVVEVTMAQRDGGNWAAATTGREMPRQNGKGDEIEVVELWGLVQRGEAILHTVHDAVLLASQAQQRMLSVIEGHADLRRLKKRAWMGTGQQMIEMRNGGAIWYRTRSGGGGRGVDDVDRLVVDEAQHATEEHLAAVSPTLTANSNPQLNIMGTAGIEGKSDWWWSVRKRALAADDQFGYVGHTAEVVYLDDDGKVVQEPVDIEDRALWFAANPILSTGRGRGLEFFEEQLRVLGPASFAREHLGVWDPPPVTDEDGPDIDMGAWAAMEDIEPNRPKPVAFALAVSDDREWASIGLAGKRDDGRRHLQIVQAGRGTGWVADRVVELVKQWKPLGVAIAPGQPEGSLIARLESAGVKVLKCTSREYAQACGMFDDGVRERTLAHMGQPQLNVSVAAARQVKSGDSTEFEAAEGRDIAPLRAVALALFAFERGHAGKRQRSGVVV